MATTAEQKQMVQALCNEYLSIPDMPLAQKQRETARDVPAKGNIWISRTKFPAPMEADLRDVLYEVCERLKAPDQNIALPQDVPLRDVGVEFIGHRPDANGNTLEPDIPEKDKLMFLQRDCESDMTILYVPGGGLFSGPSQYRATSTRLAQLTRGRTASITYRLAPQNVFPGPLLDLLVAYASLIYPPPGSHHTPVPAHRIVLAGNSAGANLCFGLLKFLLELRCSSPNQAQRDPQLRFHGRQVSLPLPAGVATCSAWCDMCDALPSWHDNSKCDILDVLQPALLPTYPPDEIWPSNPPREHLYCTASLLNHPLVSPAAVRDWSGAPPIWMACGSEERGLDGNKVVASQAASCGVPVLYNEYEGMPHEFVLLLRKLPQAEHCIWSWVRACRAFVEGSRLASRGALMKMPDCETIPVADVAQLAPQPFEEVCRRMQARNKERPVWTGKPIATAKL
ncbi:hypothetical protein MMC30_004835 [Trapelia coarctata]|nr:hypothetical protein [Trapelia coarctata]